jgi:ABC-2 type transport system permease protein
MTAEAPAVPQARHEPKSSLAISLTTFRALMERDIKVLSREFVPFLARTAIQPFLFVFVFTYVQPKIGQGARNFGDILVPGLIASAVVLQGLQAVAIPLVTEFSQTKEIEDRVMAPIPVWGVAAQKIVFAQMQALIAALAVVPFVYFVPLERPHVHIDIIVLITILPLGALLSASVGLLIGTSVSPRQIPLVFALLVVPLTFLGAVYYPWSSLSVIRWLQVLTLANPLLYMSEGLRGALTPTYGHMSYWGVYAGLIIGCIVSTFFGVRGFIRRVQT